MVLYVRMYAWNWYRIAGNFRWCKFSYELPILIFRSLNIRTAQHSDVEHTDIIVQGNFRTFKFSYYALQYEIYENFHHTVYQCHKVYTII